MRSGRSRDDASVPDDGADGPEDGETVEATGGDTGATGSAGTTGPNSGQEAAAEIDDYRDTAGKAREYLRTQSGLQPGDPQKAIAAIVAAISAPVPPKHLLLGKLAIQRWKNQLAALGTELEQWEAFGAATDFD